MATGRMIRSQISISEQVNDLSIKSAFLFTWMIPHADDWGRMHGSSRKVKALVVPMRDDFSVGDVEKCLSEIETSELIVRYEVEGEVFIWFPTWDSHQTGLHKRTDSKFPEFSGKRGNIPEIPGKVPLREEKRTKENLREENLKGAGNAPEIPEPLNTDEFKAAFQEYKTYRNEKRLRTTPTQESRLLKKLAKFPLEVAIQSINETISNGWQGVFPESVRLNGNGSRASPQKTGREQFMDELNQLEENLNGNHREEKTIDIDLEDVTG